MAIRIAIHGAGGRMGRRLMSLTCADPDLNLVGAIERAGHPLIGKAISDVEPGAKTSSAFTTHLIGEPDAMIDFSTPDALETILEDAAGAGVPLVIGTTGVVEDGAGRIEKAAKIVPIVWAPNMSLGVNLLFRLAGEAARVLADGYDVEIVEAHHNRKEDAPSGTAMGLARAVCEALERDIGKDLVHGRSGRPGARSKREIGMHALRMGSVVGEHTVHFASDFERLELTHKAVNRDVFVAGALHAAKWVVGRKAGLYDMQDVLFGQ